MMTQPRIESNQIVIEGITLHRVSIPLCEPFRISNGEVTNKDAVLVEVRTDAGITGWGEASPMSGSFYSDENPESTWRALTTQLIPSLLHNGACNATTYFERLRTLPGDAFAKAGLEGAVWDAYANSVGVPLCELLGARARPIPSGVAIGICDQTSELLERVALYLNQGYRRVKIKIQPGWDEEPVAAIRARFPDVSLMVDANGAYVISDAQVFRRLDSYCLTMIEQPLARDAYSEAGEQIGRAACR